MVGIALKVQGYAGVAGHTLPVSDSYTSQQKKCLQYLKEVCRITKERTCLRKVLRDGSSCLLSSIPVGGKEDGINDRKWPKSLDTALYSIFQGHHCKRCVTHLKRNLFVEVKTYDRVELANWMFYPGSLC